MKRKQRHTIRLVTTIFTVAGALWLPLEAFEGLNNTDVRIRFDWFAVGSIVLGSIIFFVDGLFVSRFLRKEAMISSNSFDSKIHIKIGDLFKQDGWIAIGVNNFFDSVVDGDLVAQSSLHGHVISKYWSGDSIAWQEQVDTALHGVKFTKKKRDKGNAKRYPLGTTASVIHGNRKFLFAAIAKTDRETNVASANAEALIRAVRGMLRKAREVAAHEPLNIPLMGSGLARVSIKDSLLVHLILTAIFEETKGSKVTSIINVILHEDNAETIDINAIAEGWEI